MTNTKEDLIDCSSALEDAILGSLNCVSTPRQQALLEQALQNGRDLMQMIDKQSIVDVPPTDQNDKKENVATDYVLRAAEQYRQYHRTFCKKLIREFIQQHIYVATNSTEWEQLDERRRTLTTEITRSGDPAKLKSLTREKDIIAGRIENLLIHRVYYGALDDSMSYPDTLDELRCMFGDKENPTITFGPFDKKDQSIHWV